MRRALAVVAALALAVAARADRPVRIGTKHFTEQLVLGEIVAQLVESAGMKAERRFGMQGTLFCFEALRADQIDLYPEYTGTGLVAILKGDVPPDPRLVFEQVRLEFLSRFDLLWRAPLGFNNTYALAVRPDVAREKRLRTITDLVAHASGLTLGCGTEFLARSDGYPGLRSRYGLKFADARAMDPGLTYEAVARGAVDVIDAYATDGRLQKYGLTVLEDDRKFFPPYDAALLIRRDALERWPRLGPVLARLSYTIDDATMRALNHEVEAKGRTPREVAASFLARTGMLGAVGHRDAPAEAPPPQGGLARIWARRARIAKLTLEHLQLTFTAVLFAALFGIPLGVALTRAPRLAAPVLGVVSTLQTLPSLAVLGFLIPVTGIGAKPAILALIVYALLPIVRNAYTGVTGVPAELVEAGRGLGMTPRQLLTLVELPLALPVIMAGVRTATVICAGTATLAALIGAGGLGEPIFRGIALVDGPTILSGAIPAAALALALDALLGAIQRRLEPPRGSC